MYYFYYIKICLKVHAPKIKKNNVCILKVLRDKIYFLLTYEFGYFSIFFNNIFLCDELLLFEVSVEMSSRIVMCKMKICYKKNSIKYICSFNNSVIKNIL